MISSSLYSRGPAEATETKLAVIILSKLNIYYNK